MVLEVKLEYKCADFPAYTECQQWSVCGTPCLLLAECVVIPPLNYANLEVKSVWRSLYVTAKDQVCGTPCLTCGRALVCGLSLPVSLVEPNTIMTGVRCSLPLTAQDQVCGTPCLTCGRALVCGISMPVSLSRTNTLAIGCAALPARHCTRASVRISLLVLVEVRLWQCICAILWYM
jgi:hypothetical protein